VVQATGFVAEQENPAPGRGGGNGPAIASPLPGLHEYCIESGGLHHRLISVTPPASEGGVFSNPKAQVPNPKEYPGSNSQCKNSAPIEASDDAQWFLFWILDLDS
jgi:hypothetical protein